MTKAIRFATAALGAILFCAPTARAEDAKPAKLDTVRVFADYTPSGPILSFLYGVKAGIYKKYGIDVVYRSLGATALSADQLVAQKQAEFALGDVSNYLRLRLAGSPLIAVMGMVQGNANGIIMRKDSGVTKASQLAGTKFALIQNSISARLLSVFLKENNIDPNKVEVHMMSVAAKNQAFLAGQVQGTIAFPDVVAPIYRDKGVDVNIIRFNDVNLTTTLDTRQDLVESNPDLVKRFVQATAEAYIKAQADPKAAAQASFDMANGTASPVPVLEKQLTGILSFVSTKRGVGKPLGWMSEEDWRDTIKFQEANMNLKPGLKAKDMFTNVFVESNPVAPAWASAGIK